MPANFTQQQRQEIREKLLIVGFEMLRETGLKSMKIAEAAKRADIAAGTFYHFFPSKEAYVMALIEERGRAWKQEFSSLVQAHGKLPLELAVRCFRESFRPENNLLMELSLEDWVWLKSHRTAGGLFDAMHDLKEAEGYLAYIDGIRPDLDVRVLINFFKTIYSMAQNRDTFVQEVLETNIDLIFDCMYRYAAVQERERSAES